MEGQETAGAREARIAAAHRAQAEQGQRAALALEYVGKLIDDEIDGIYDALARPRKGEDIESLVMGLRAFVFVKNKLEYQKAVGIESAAKLREGAI